jgi:alanine racemase
MLNFINTTLNKLEDLYWIFIQNTQKNTALRTKILNYSLEFEDGFSRIGLWNLPTKILNRELIYRQNEIYTI